jgi:DNA polymerase-3 subunit beta
MKTTIETKRLIAFLQSTKSIETKSVIQTENIKLEFSKNQCRAFVTDCEISAICTIPCNGDEFTLCLPRKKLLDVLKASKKDAVVMGYENCVFKVNGCMMNFILEKHYVGEVEINEARTLLFSPVLNYEIIEASKFIGTDCLRAVFSGVCVENTHGSHCVVSTDSHRLYEANLGASSDESYCFILPYPKIIGAFIKGMNLLNECVSVTFNGVNAELKYGDCAIVLRLINERYPNYNAIIPQERTNVLRIDKNALQDAIAQIMPAVSGITKQVMLCKTETGVRVVGGSINSDLYMEVDVLCNWDAAQDYKIAFNSVFFTDLLKSCLSPEIGIEMKSNTYAAVIRDLHRTLLIMPQIIKDPQPETESEVGDEVDCETEEETTA